VLQGQHASTVGKLQPGMARVYDSHKGFLGVGELSSDGRLAPKRLFAEPIDISE
jgi:hypothetical protein